MCNACPRYASPFTDYGFKRLFGQPLGREMLLNFLNELLREEQGTITQITYLNPEQQGNTPNDRRAIFDLYCQNERGERFIVEMQNTKQDYFKDRMMFYATFPIQQQADRHRWNFELTAVYAIAILDFVFDEDQDEPDKYRYDIMLREAGHKEPFYDKLTFIYLAMPKFRKGIDELANDFERWLYVIKNIGSLDRYPPELKGRIFRRFFDLAEVAQFDRSEHDEYQESLRVYRDLKNSFDSAIREGEQKGLQKGLSQGMAKGREIGHAEGRLEGKLEGLKEGKIEGIKEGKILTARSMLEKGIPLATVLEVTGLDESDLQA
ncbi:MAG: hypothetical protein CSA07_03185 [Bacteroidia bacterium]|nr:MAG: hypothetical protein CSA07_03185 [Bacteroidia bacterium]